MGSIGEMILLVIETLLCIGVALFFVSGVLRWMSLAAARSHGLACKDFPNHAKTFLGKQRLREIKKFNSAHRLFCWIGCLFFIQAFFYGSVIVPPLFFIAAPALIYGGAAKIMDLLVANFYTLDQDSRLRVLRIAPLFKYRLRKHLFFAWLAYAAGLMWIVL